MHGIGLVRFDSEKCRTTVISDTLMESKICSTGPYQSILLETLMYFTDIICDGLTQRSTTVKQEENYMPLLNLKK